MRPTSSSVGSGLRFRAGLGRRRVAAFANGRKGRAPETAYGCARGTKLWSANPMSGSGMKQGRQARGGTKRQEVEKTWRRRQSGEASPPTRPLPRAGRRCRGTNVKGGSRTVASSLRRRAGPAARSLGALCRRAEAHERSTRLFYDRRGIPRVRTPRSPACRPRARREHLTDVGASISGSDTLKGAATP